MPINKDLVVGLFNSGKSQIYLSYRFNCSKQRIHQIVRNYRSINKKTTLFKKIEKDICEICGSKNNLEIHHIDGESLNNDELNLINVCNKCHKIEDIKNKQGIPRYNIDMRKTNLLFFTRCVVCKQCFTTKNPKSRFCSSLCIGLNSRIYRSREETLERNRQAAKRFYKRHKFEKKYIDRAYKSNLEYRKKNKLKIYKQKKEKLEKIRLNNPEKYKEILDKKKNYFRKIYWQNPTKFRKKAMYYYNKNKKSKVIK